MDMTKDSRNQDQGQLIKHTAIKACYESAGLIILHRLFMAKS